MKGIKWIMSSFFTSHNVSLCVLVEDGDAKERMTVKYHLFVSSGDI